MEASVFPRLHSGLARLRCFGKTPAEGTYPIDDLRHSAAFKGDNEFSNSLLLYYFFRALDIADCDSAMSFP